MKLIWIDRNKWARGLACICSAERSSQFHTESLTVRKGEKKSHKIIIIQYISGNKKKNIIIIILSYCLRIVYFRYSFRESFVYCRQQCRRLTSDLLHNRIIKHYIKFLIFFTLVRGWFRFIILYIFFFFWPTILYCIYISYNIILYT